MLGKNSRNLGKAFFSKALYVHSYALNLSQERTNEVQVANTYSERRTEVEIFQYNGMLRYSH